MIYTNLITNPSFTDGTTGWTGNNVTLSTSTTEHLYGVSSLTLTTTATSNTWAYTNSISVTAGETYTLSSYVLSATTTRNMYVQVTWYDASSTIISISNGTQVASSSSDWTRVSVTADAPALATTAICYVVIATPASGEVHYVDAVQFENSILATQFIDSYSQTQETDITNDGMRKLLEGDPETKPYITGLKLEGDISINGLVLNSIDENKVVWVCTDIEGWWNLPDPEIPDIPRGLDDGSYDVRGRWKARDLVLKGSILPPTPAYGAVARQTLVEALALVYTGGWLLVNEGTVKSAYVRLYGKPTLENVNARGRIDFTLPLRSVDPVKYSWNPNDANGITTTNLTPVAIGNTTSTVITNEGNTDVTAVFSITGPMTAPAYIKNTTTNSAIKIIKSLRSNSYVADTTSRSRTSGVSTLTTSSPHKFLVGDIVTVANVAIATFNGTFTVTAADTSTISYADPGKVITSATLLSNTVAVIADSHGFSTGETVYISNLGYPYDGTYILANASTNSFSYARTAADADTAYDGKASRDITSGSDAADVTLTNTDTLQIDTYNTTVLYRGLPDSARSTIDVDVDWIKLEPGPNNIIVEKTAGTPTSATIKYKSGWIG